MNSAFGIVGTTQKEKVAERKNRRKLSATHLLDNLGDLGRI